MRIGIEPFKQLRRWGLLQDDGCHKPQDVIPVLLDDLTIDGSIGEELKALLLIDFAFEECRELPFIKPANSWSKKDA